MKTLLLALTLLPFLATAGEKINEQIEVPVNKRIFIDNQRGDVRIEGWDKPQLQITGELDDKAQGYRLEDQGGRIEFVVKMPRNNNGWNRGDGSQLVIYMPNSSELEFTGVNATISVKNLNAGADIDVVNGDINLQSISGNISVDTVNGDVSAIDLKGDIRYETVNGEINDKDSQGTLRFTAVNGDIKSKTAAQEVRLENVNGDIDFAFVALKSLRISTVNGESEIHINELLKGAQITYESVSGDADFYFPANVSARFEIEAHANGKIINELSNDKAKKAKYGPSSDLEFAVNGGDADIEIDTISGRIELRKKN
ncbi:MAG TPA: hypothetical protein ENH88_04525 [Pseudoalteromonas prydzensis]|uniref:DUF4097 domain-containing protein n=1 Tax=Pseudoalteromonas prydzensis TaxID=182141 RepID=A0A7V1GDB9_9GAMM|nr:DUF4097 family beta strand repeat-containing protein [Pseudoalteromonas prydzensis]HEA15710.1 hypothetical protein [Pseudoalteromonas prydzensis]